MATYLSQPYQGSPFQSGVPLDLVMQVGMRKQAMYDQRQAELQSSLDRIGNYEIVKDADRAVIGEKLKNVVNKINEFSSTDLTDNRNYNQLMSLTSGVFNDDDMYSRIAANRNYLNESKRLAKIRAEKPDEYSADNERVFQAQVNKWLSDPNQKSFNATYTPYYDYTKEQKSIIDEVRQNPDVMRAIEYFTDENGNQIKRGEREIKQVTEQRIAEALMGSMSDRARRQMMTEYQSMMLDKNEGTAVKELEDRIKGFDSQIKTIQDAMDAGDVSEGEWGTKSNELDVLGKVRKRHADMLKDIKTTGDISGYYNPSNYLTDRIGSIAQGFAYRQEGQLDNDLIFSETFKNKMAKDLEEWKVQKETEKALTLGQAGIGTKGTKIGGSAPGITNEFKTRIWEIVDKGEGRLDAEAQKAVLNASGKIQEDGSYVVPVGGKDIMLDVQPALSASGADVNVQKAQGIAKITDMYNNWVKSPGGHKAVHVTGNTPSAVVANPLTSGSEFTYGSKTTPSGAVNPYRQKEYDKLIKQGYQPNPNDPNTLIKLSGYEANVPKSFDEFVQAMQTSGRLKENISKLFGTNLKGDKPGVQGPQINSGTDFVNDFKNKYGIDITSKEDLAAAKAVAGSPETMEVMNRIGTMLKDKRFSGRLNIVPADGNNTFTGSDGQLYTKGYAQMTRNQLTPVLDGNSIGNVWGAFGSRGLDKLIEDGIIVNTHVKNGNEDEIYQVPIVLKVDEDLSTANNKYLIETRGKDFAEKSLPAYEADFKNDYTNLELVKKYSKNPTPLISAAGDKVDTLLSSANPSIRGAVKSAIKSYEDKLSVSSSTDRVRMLSELSKIASSNTPEELQSAFGINVKLPGDSIAAVHNNPGNLKYADWMTRFGATPGKPGSDGGRFASFPTVDSALKAREELLFNRSYSRLTVDEAMKRYSNFANGGYDGSIYPEIRSKKMNQLTDAERKELLRRQLQKEDSTVYNSLIQQGVI